MVGLLENINEKMTLDFKEEGDVIYLLGKSTNDISSSQYLAKICNVEFSPAPYFELEEEFLLQQKVTELINKKLIQSAHDISEGGLFVMLCESGFNRDLGFTVETKDDLREDAYLFGEAQSRVVVTVKAGLTEKFENALRNFLHIRIGLVPT